MTEYDPKEMGAVIGTLEFTLENLAKIHRFLGAGDLESAERYLEGLTMILKSETKRITLAKKVSMK